MGRKRRKFTPEFKTEVVRLCKVGDRSIGQVAKDLDLTDGALREWVKRADIDTGQVPPGALTRAERVSTADPHRAALPLEERIRRKMVGTLRREPRDLI